MKSRPFNKNLESNTQLYKKTNMVGNRVGKQKHIKYINQGENSNKFPIKE